MQGPTGVGVVTSFVQNGILGNSDLENVYIWSIPWNIPSIFGVDGRKFGPEWLQIPKGSNGGSVLSRTGSWSILTILTPKICGFLQFQDDSLTKLMTLIENREKVAEKDVPYWQVSSYTRKIKADQNLIGFLLREAKERKEGSDNKRIRKFMVCIYLFYVLNGSFL